MLRNVVVTGAGGFLGRSLAVRLASRGAKVWAVVRELAEVPVEFEELAGIVVVRCDLENYSKLKSKIDCCTPPDALFHFAWAGTSGSSRADTSLQLANVEAACEAVRQARALHAGRFVFAGSIMEHECLQHVMKDGSNPGLGCIYSVAKLAADCMCKTVAASIDQPYVGLMLSNVYGPGELSPRFANTMIGRLLRGERLELTSCAQPYDFMYLDDALDAMEIVGENGERFKSYYIGNERQRALKEFVEIMQQEVNPSAELSFGSAPIDGIFLDYEGIDTEALSRDFFFRPKVDFPEGVRRTMLWLEEHMDAAGG